MIESGSNPDPDPKHWLLGFGSGPEVFMLEVLKKSLLSGTVHGFKLHLFEVIFSGILSRSALCSLPWRCSN